MFVLLVRVHKMYVGYMFHLVHIHVHKFILSSLMPFLDYSIGMLISLGVIWVFSSSFSLI